MSTRTCGRASVPWRRGHGEPPTIFSLKPSESIWCERREPAKDDDTLSKSAANGPGTRVAPDGDGRDAVAGDQRAGQSGGCETREEAWPWTATRVEEQAETKNLLKYLARFLCAGLGRSPTYSSDTTERPVFFAASAKVSKSGEAGIRSESRKKRGIVPRAKERPVLVTTNQRGVFFGYLVGKAGPVVKLKRARNAIYWSEDMQGFLGLAAKGPSGGCRIGPAVEEIELLGVTSVSAVSPAAVERWEKAWWG